MSVLRDARKRAGLTLANMEAACGLSNQVLSRIETFGRPVKLTMAQRLEVARVYQVSLDALEHCPAGPEPIKANSPNAKRAGRAPKPKERTPMFEDRVTLTKAELAKLQMLGDPFPERPLHGKGFWWPTLSATLESIEDDLYYNRMVAIIGPSGAGKSTLLATVRDNLEAAKDTITIDLVATDRARLNDWTVEITLLEALGVTRSKIPGNATERLQKLTRLLSRSAKEKRRLVLLCDDFHDVTDRLLKQLRRLREADPRSVLFGAVLMGQPPLAEALRSEELREVGGRVQILEMPRLGGIDPLNQNRPLQNYGHEFIKWSFAQLGMPDAERYFTPEASHQIAELAEHPLWVKNLGSRALKELAARGAGRPVDPALIAKLARRR